MTNSPTPETPAGTPAVPPGPQTPGPQAPVSQAPDAQAPGTQVVGTQAPGTRVVGISLGHRETSEADHWIRSLTPPPTLACTHLVREPFPHVAITLAGVDAPETAPDLRPAADLAAAATTGRAVIFPGGETLVGTLTVGQVLATTAIDRIEILGGGTPDPETLLDTGAFVRPQYRGETLILTVMPAAEGRLVPFETRNPTPCCGAH